MNDLKFQLKEIDSSKEYFLFIDEQYADDVAKIQLEHPATIHIIPTLNGELLDREAAEKLLRETK